LTPLSLCGVVSIEIRQKTSTRDTRIKNVLRIHVSQNRAGREFRRNSGEITQYQGMFLSLPFARKVLIFFLFLFFCLFKRKGVKFGGQMECVVHSSFTSRVEEMDARWTNRSFLSRNIFVEKMCAKKEILSRLSRFAKRVSHGARERPKALAGKEKARKNLKTGLFSRFRLSISSLTKKTNFSPNSLLCVLL
jgi:hypothetical protein